VEFTNLDFGIKADPDESLAGEAWFTGVVIDNVRQIDHLQYGYAPIPEPSLTALLALAFATVALHRRRKL